MKMHFAGISLFAALGLGMTTTAQAAPKEAPRVVEAAGGFSYLPPLGWTVVPGSGSQYTRCYSGPPGKRAVLFIRDLPASGPLNFGFTSDDMTLTRYNTGPVVTASGLRGYHENDDASTTHKASCFVFYVFPVKGHRVLVTALWPPPDCSKFIPAVDAAMMTFRLQ